MVYPRLESLEPRQLLSVLAAGQAQLFDFTGDGVMDGVLVNTGTSAINYTYTGGSVIDRVDIAANGASFVSSGSVAEVGDTSSALDFTLGSAQIGVSVKYKCHTYKGVAGDTSVIEGAIGTLQLGAGNLLSAQSTQGNIDKVTLCNGNLVDALSATSIGSILVGGDVTGSVTAATGGIASLSADSISGAIVSALSGTIAKITTDQITAGAQITAAQIGCLTAGTIDGGSSIISFGDIGTVSADLLQNAGIQAYGKIDNVLIETISGFEGGITSIATGGKIGRLVSDTITGGQNGFLSIAVGGGINSMTVGLLEGGQSVNGGFTMTSIAVNGGIGKLQAGLITGGTATGAGSFVLLSLGVNDQYDPDYTHVVAYGDVGTMRVAAITGGEAIDGGEAQLSFGISHDLIDGRVSQIIGHGTHRPTCDPSVYFSVGHDIVKLVAGQITAGQAGGDYAYASVDIAAGNDIVSLTAGTVDGGTADGIGATSIVRITAGRDIQAITATTFGGGTAAGEGASAGVFVNAGRDIDFIGSQLITGTRGRVHQCDPTVQFWAGGDIGLVAVGRITGGSVSANGDTVAQSSVLLRADGTYIDENGVQSLGDIGKIVTGTIDGGSANGADALTYVKISAAHDIDKLYSDEILGGRASNGGTAYVSILAEHNINDLQADLIAGTESDGCGGGYGDGCGHGGCGGGWGGVCGSGCGSSSDPEVQIQAYNDIKNFAVGTIEAGNGGLVNILAGIDANGNVSGETDANGVFQAGSIEKMVVNLISGDGGIVNIAAGGDIEQLKVCRIVSGDGEVNIVAGGDITANIGSIRSWSIQGETGVNFEAGGVVNDVHNTIAAQFTSEGAVVEFPEPIVEAA
jgi:hypothetical protein